MMPAQPPTKPPFKRFAILPLLAIACGPALATTADATYGGQQAACVDRYSTKAQIDECRARVDKAWCVVDGAPTCTTDAGADQ